MATMAATRSKKPSHDYLLKVLVIGESGVGKSNLLLRFADDVFCEHHLSTIGVDFKLKDVVVEDKAVKLQIWDTAGQDRFRAIVRTFYRNADAVVLTYDITSSDSLAALKENWLVDVRAYAPKAVTLIVVGNKSDLADQRQVSEAEGRAFADSLGAEFCEASAKLDTNVDEIFERLAREMMTKAVRIHRDKGEFLEPPPPERPTPKCACAIM